MKTGMARGTGCCVALLSTSEADSVLDDSSVDVYETGSDESCAGAMAPEMDTEMPISVEGSASDVSRTG